MVFSIKSVLIAIAVVCALGFGNSGVAMAQETDEIAKSLETVRLRYEDGLEIIRRDVLNEIEKMRRFSIREDDPVAARKRVEAIEDAFRNEGELPDVQKRNAWIERYNYWKDTLDRSYAKTVLDYQAAGNDALAEVVAAEQELFGKQLDLVPWGPNLIESPIEVSPDKPLEIEAGINGEYRIEIRATRVEGEGILWVELPVAGKECVRVPLVSDSSGSFDAMLTVSPKAISCDAGFVMARKTQFQRSLCEEMHVRVETNDVAIIEAISLKPMVRGEVRQVEVDQGRTSERPRAVDPFPVGLFGRGDCKHHASATSTMQASVRVDQRDGSSVDFIITIEGTGETFRVTCRSNGKDLRVVNAEQLKAPAKKAPFTVQKTEGGFGSLRNGVLSLRWTMRGNSPNMAKNRAWTVEVRNAEMR